MAKKIINRFGRVILVGDVATMQHPRGGLSYGRIKKIAKEWGGYRLTLHTGISGFIDDVVNIIDRERIETVAKHFIIAAIWADKPEEIETDVVATKDSKKNAYNICANFIAQNLQLFLLAMKADGYGSHPDAGSPEAAFGHDLWLTMQAHGVGYWCRSELDADGVGDMLNEACCAHGAPSYDFTARYFHLYS